MKAVLIVCLALGLVSFSVWSAGDSVAGQKKSTRCMACHGIHGRISAQMYPSLAGKDALYLEKALQAYRNGERSGGQAEIMRAYVVGLSDTDMADLAAYYSTLPP